MGSCFEVSKYVGVALAAVPLWFPCVAAGQAPAVPSTFQPIYTELTNYLDSFNATLAAGSNPPYPTLMSACLKSADSNSGPQLINGMSGTAVPLGTQLQINALQAMGVQALLVEVGFPMLYQPFMDSQSPTYQAQFTAYYQAVIAAVRAAGMKVIIENDTLLTNDVQAGWDAAPFYSTMSWEDYEAARAQTAVYIAQELQPDYLVLLQEPTTEANNSGQTNANTLSGSLSLLSGMVTAVRQAGVPNVKLGAGTGTAQFEPTAVQYIQEYVTVPLDFIDIHIYPINDNYLPIALQIAGIASSAGLPLSMTECWLWKVLDTELNVLTDDQIRARDPFDFWGPLDAYFLQTMQSLANTTQMLFMDPFGSTYFFAALPYNDSTEDLSPSAILVEENSAASQANQNAQPYTISGMSYYQSLVNPPDVTPPSVPAALAGHSANPTQASLNWAPASDNVGVVGYYILRNGSVVGQTGMLQYQDGGLSEATTYSYSVAAFDLAGNVSTPSGAVLVQTSDVTPPSTPTGVAVQATACTKVSLTWLPSQDNVGVMKYLVFMGLSADSLSQVATPTKTSYGNSTLSPATTYYFAVAAEDKDQNVSYLSQVVQVTTPALPVAPAGLLVTPSSDCKISVTWLPSTGGLPIAHYLVYRGTTPSSLTQVAIVNNTLYKDPAALPGTTYYYAIQAADTGKPPSQSGLSGPAAGTSYGPPGTPPNLTATPISCTKVALTWSAAESGGLPVANYRVYKGSSLSSMVQLAITTNLFYNDTGDTAGTTYYYAVQSADTAKPPDVSIISPAVSATTYAIPSTPANVAGLAVSGSEITLTWTESVNGLPIARYLIYMGTSPSGMNQAGTVTSGTSYNSRLLTPGTTYYYSVEAVDTANDDSAQSTPIPVVTDPLPTAPSNVTAQGMSSSEIVVSWAASTGVLSIRRYTIFRGTTPDGMTQLGTTTKTTYTDRSVTPGTTYYYAVEATDSGNDTSPMSSPPAPGSTQE